jgi:hypothetical protein
LLLAQPAQWQTIMAKISNTISFLNEIAYQETLEETPGLVDMIRRDIEAGMSPEAIKRQVSFLYDGTRPAELRRVYQIALHLAARREAGQS